jgi:predicted Zn-dependent protease with MMP-like domain
VRSEQNKGVKPDWEELKHLALEEIETTLTELPRPLREQAQGLPVTFERVPNLDFQSDGIEPETLGLFTGAEFADEGASVLPPQIILFLENIWKLSAGDVETYKEEIQTTFLHELGHFFGLDEYDLTARGLD